jgi:fibronectin type 3 domain-containing protein
MNIKKLLGIAALFAIIVATAFAVGRITAGPASVTLAWDKSPGTNVIAKYNIYYGPSSGTYTNVQSAGTNLTTTVSNLVRGATYWFAATAVDTSALESDYSTEVSTVTKTQPAPPPNTRITDSN